MARDDIENIVTQSILDRLIDLEPTNSSEVSMRRAESVRALRTSVRRDLEWLLNTRRIPTAADERYPELRQSLYNYGLPDFSTLSAASTHDRKRLLNHIEETIRIFEPRIDSPRVVAVETENAEGNRVLRFQIEGLLKMDPAPEHVTFDTVLQMISGEYQVKG